MGFKLVAEKNINKYGGINQIERIKNIMKNKQELINEFTDLRQRSINWIPDTAREAELRTSQIESFDTILAILKGEAILESD